MHRHQLTDEQWSIVEPLIPKKHARTGRPPADRRQMLDGIMWILRTGAPWRDLPDRFGPFQCRRFHCQIPQRGYNFQERVDHRPAENK